MRGTWTLKGGNYADVRSILQPGAGQDGFRGAACACARHRLAAFFALGVFHEDAGLADANTPEENGRQLAQSLCAACHSIEKTGDSPNSDAPPFRTFKERWPLEHLEEALAEGIVTGHDNVVMPEYEFEPDEISELIAFMNSI